MEQTNLVVTADGKTWDEVTRDTSYIGNIVLSANTDTVHAWNNRIILDEWRGKTGNSSGMGQNHYNKDFAIAYDRLICLRAGVYQITIIGNATGTASWLGLDKNTSDLNLAAYTAQNTSDDTTTSIVATLQFDRGDTLDYGGEYGGNTLNQNWFQIIRVE